MISEVPSSTKTPAVDKSLRSQYRIGKFFYIFCKCSILDNLKDLKLHKISPTPICPNYSLRVME